MFDTLGQPFVSLWFILAGTVAYGLYEFFYAVKMILPFKVISIITDFLSVMGAGAIFFFTALKFNYGRLLFYEFLCFGLAFYITRLILKNTLRKMFSVFMDKLKNYLREQKKILNNKIKSAQTKLERRKYERQQLKQQRIEQKKLQRERMQLRRKNREPQSEHSMSGKPSGKRQTIPQSNVFLHGKTRTDTERSGSVVRSFRHIGSRPSRSLQKRLHRKGKRGNPEKFFFKQRLSESSHKTI